MVLNKYLVDELITAKIGSMQKEIWKRRKDISIRLKVVNSQERLPGNYLNEHNKGSVLYEEVIIGERVQRYETNSHTTGKRQHMRKW